MLLSTVAAPLCIPTSRAPGFQFLHILASTYFLFFAEAILMGVRCLSPGFDLHFPND